MNAAMIVETPAYGAQADPRAQPDRLSRTGNENPPATPLSLDDVVALAAVVERVTGHALSPNQSSALKCAYQAARTHLGGPTLQAIADALNQGHSYG